MKYSTQKLNNGIATTLYFPENRKDTAAIILCHGFCGIQDILLPAYAEAFARAGFTALTFDYHGFGASEGERGRLLPEQQIQDIVAVIDWVKAQPDIDAERIGLWGTSLGGCHVFGAALERPEIKCIVSQMGFADGEEIVLGGMSPEERENFVATVEKMAEKRKRTGKEMWVAITKVMVDAESRRFFDSYKEVFPAMDIKIPFLTVRETLLYKPGENAARVNCPTSVVVASKDKVNPPEQGIALYEAAGGTVKSLYVAEGAGHYDMYEGDNFKKIIQHQINWFNRYLK